MPSAEGGLGSALLGEKILVNHRPVTVTKLLGEGGFSYVYLVKDISDTSIGQSLNSTANGGEASGNAGGGRRSSSKAGESNGTPDRKEMVLKVTSIISRQQRDIAEKEAKLLQRLSHPSIIKMYDTCYRAAPQKSGRKDDAAGKKERPQHLILMELCEGGHALDVCNNLLAHGKRFDLSTLIIAFGQICNAVSYLHAQRPPIVHRDLKPANFLVKGGAYKLCDFGSAVFGHVDLKTPQARNDAEEVIQKTTTQMFRAPEMVDLFSAKKLTQATDVWALGCCLYSMAFLQNCFEEGSNLAILSRKYKIPDDNPYGKGLAELIDRMLTVDVKARSDMTEVILCLSAVYSGRELPPRKTKSTKKESKKEKGSEAKLSQKKKKSALQSQETADAQKTPKEGKQLNPNSVAARRKKSATVNSEFSSFNSKFEEMSAEVGRTAVDADEAFATSAESFAAAFGDAKGTTSGDEVFNAFADNNDVSKFDTGQGWANDDAAADAFASFTPEPTEASEGRKAPGRTRSTSTRRPRRKEQANLSEEAVAAATKAMSSMESNGDSGGVQKIAVRRGTRRGLRRQNSAGDGLRRSRSKSRGRIRTSKPEDSDESSGSDD